MGKISFTGGLNIEGTIELTSLISVENEKQNGANFKEFIDLINNNNQKINNLILIDTTYLNRHYDNKWANLDMDLDWYKRNKHLIENLKIKHEVRSWRTIVQTREYKDNHAKVLLDYQGDPDGNDIDTQFRHVVNQLAQEYFYKGTQKSVIKYILEECAGSLTLKSHVTYPGKFNAAITYVMEKYKPDMQLHKYRLRANAEKNRSSYNDTTRLLHQKGIQINNILPEDSNKNMYSTHTQNGYNLTLFGMSIGYIVDSFKIDAEQQPQFFSEFLQFCNKFKQPPFLSQITVSPILEKSPNGEQYNETTPYLRINQ